jgi:hypothetical protein
MAAVPLLALAGSWRVAAIPFIVAVRRRMSGGG